MKKYKNIIEHYENCLEKYGDSHLGVDWPKEEDVFKRYRVMMELISLNNEIDEVSLLDFGCGTGHLMDFIKKDTLTNVKYSGLDISEKFIAICNVKYPGTTFYCGDILNHSLKIPQFDYFVMNGVFTEKRELSFDEMWDYFTQMIIKIYSLCNKGFAFNVMSKHVDWERDDLFHVPLDTLANFLCSKITRDFVIRNDYGLYEYTVYIYKK